MGIFKAYDIRGIYGTELNEEIAEKIGRAFITYLGAKTVVIGRDMRPHSIPLADALTRGMVMQGATVYDQGLCSTPMNYFANGALGVDGSIMITASHNPAPYNGFKLCRGDAVPLSGDAGIKDLEQIIKTGSYAPAKPGGTVKLVDFKQAYWDKFRAFAKFKAPVNVAIDHANAMGIVEMEGLKDLYNGVVLYDTLDGTFPNHEANPLKHDTLLALGQAVRDTKALFGASFDGDADRCGFVDEKGAPISLDLCTALIAKSILETTPGATILYDLRSSWAVKEFIEAHGGRAVMSRVGHAFIKNQMREENAVFAGELAGHYYFKENCTAESSCLALIMMTNIVVKSGLPISELVKPLQKYFYSGEINTHFADLDAATAVMEQVAALHTAGNQFRLDGVTTEYEDWWFNIRRSNTEPLLRIIVEAKTRERMEAQRDALLAIIRAHPDAKAEGGH